MGTNEIIHVACSTDDNYAALCGVMLCSLLENNKKNRVHIHILEHRLDDKQRNKLLLQSERYGARCTFHDINDAILEGCKYRSKVHQLSKAAYYRILLPSVLNEIDKVLYLDCDMIVRKDLCDLYSKDLNGYPLAAVRDYDQVYNKEHYEQLRFSDKDEYFNSGLLLINLCFWRENNSEESLISFAKSERKVFFHDQDALNFVFKNNWIRLQPSWNRYNVFNIHCKGLFENKKEVFLFRNNPGVVHYPGQLFKPWFTNFFIPYKSEWDYYRKKSEWSDFGYLKNPKPFFALFKILFVKLKFGILFRTSYYIKK